MDLEKTQKINFMVKELQKHGFADYSDGASELASEMYGQETPGSSQDERLATFEKRIEQRTDAAVRGMNGSNAEIKEEITKMWQVMGRINKQILNLASAQVEPEIVVEEKSFEEAEPTQTEEEDPEEAEEVQTQLEPEPEPEQKTNDTKKETTGRLRTGDYNSDDVSVEKIFYFGNK